MTHYDNYFIVNQELVETQQRLAALTREHAELWQNHKNLSEAYKISKMPDEESQKKFGDWSKL